jgi:hypothetical protein
VVNHCKPRELGVASRQSPVMTRLPRCPGSTLILRLNQETVHDFSLLLLPPCGPHLTPSAIRSLKPRLLVRSTLGGQLAWTFHACSSPAPTPIQSQPAPTILSQESVHTTLSITHHTRKRPSTGPRTTQALKSHLDGLGGLKRLGELSEIGKPQQNLVHGMKHGRAYHVYMGIQLNTKKIETFDVYSI